MKEKRTNRRYRIPFLTGSKGNAIVIFAIVLPVVVGVSGLVLDFGRGVWTKTQMKRAADAAALTGAANLPNQSLAYDKARGLVETNYASPDRGYYTPDGQNYRVTLEEDLATNFMKLFGYESMLVKVTSVATRPQPVAGLRGGGFPFAIINPNLNNDPNDDLVPGNYGRRYVIGYGENNVMVGDWARGLGPIASNPGQGNGNAQGWRGALSLNHENGTYGNAGGSDLRDNLIYGWKGDMRIGDIVPTETGNITGPLTQGRDGLLGSNPMDWNDFHVDSDWKTSRIVMVPIIHLRHATRMDTYTVADWENGAPWDNQYVVVDGFAPFFILTDKEQGDVDGDNKKQDKDWLTGYFVPGVQINNYLKPSGPVPNFGAYSTPRLIE